MTNNRSGFTLLEVIIAFMILSVGVFVIVTVFPRGYQAYVHSLRQDTALSYLSNMEEQLKDYKNDGVFPAGGIVNDSDAYLVNYTYEDLSSVMYSGSPWFKKFAFPNLDESIEWIYEQPMSARIMRRIIGEEVTIPTDFSERGGTESGYFALAPTLFARFAPMQIDTANPLQVYDIPYKRVTKEVLLEEMYSSVDLPNQISDLEYKISLESDPDELAKLNNQLDILLAQRERQENGLFYSVNYETGSITLLPSSKNRQIRLSFLYTNSAGEIRKHAPEIREVLAGSTDISISGIKLVPSSEVLQRAYIYVNDDSRKLTLNSGEYYIDTSDSIVTGFIFFSQNDVGKKVKIDYTVADWGIISEDLTASDKGEIVFALPPQLVRRGINNMALSKLLTANTDIMFILLDLSTGEQHQFVVDGDLQKSKRWVSGGYTMEATNEDNVYKLTANFGTDSPDSRQFKAFYRSSSNRLIQYFKPPSLFNFVPPSNDEVADPEVEFANKRNLNFDSYSYSGNTIAVSAIYAKQKVTVDYKYKNGSGKIIEVAGEVHTIPPPMYGKVISIFNLRQRPVENSIVLVKGNTASLRMLWRNSGSGLANIINTTDDSVSYAGNKLNFVWSSRTMPIGVKER